MATDLFESGSAIAGATGVATVILGPARAFERWVVTGVAITNTSSVNEPKCRVYRNGVSPSNFLGGSFSGRQDNGPEDVILMTGEKYIAQWEGADVGSVGTITLTGRREGR